MLVHNTGTQLTLVPSSPLQKWQRVGGDADFRLRHQVAIIVKIYLSNEAFCPHDFSPPADPQPVPGVPAEAAPLADGGAVRPSQRKAAVDVQPVKLLKKEEIPKKKVLIFPPCGKTEKKIQPE